MATRNKPRSGSGNGSRTELRVVVEQLQERVDELEHQLANERQERRELQERVDELESENSKLRDELADERVARAEGDDELADEIENHRRSVGQNFDGVHSRLGDIESRVDGLEKAQTQGAVDVDDGGRSFDTPLENIVAWQQHVAESELKINQERARLIASGAREFATPIAEGFEHAEFAARLTSREVRQIIKAAENRQALPARETANRVIRFLDELGKDGIQVQKVNGMKNVLFTDEMLDRLESANELELCRPVFDGSLDSGVTVSVTAE